MLDYNLSSNTHGTIDLVPGVPKASLDLLMQNSKANYAEGNYGKLILQEVDLNDFSVHYNIYHIQTLFSLHVTCTAPALMINMALKNDMQYHLESIGDVQLKEGQFNIVYLPSVDATVLFEQAGEYRVFKICLSKDILREYAPTFPYLNEFLEQVNESFPAVLLKENGWINAEISYIVNQLLQCTYDEAIRKLYYDSLVKELLLLLLLQKNKDPVNGQQYMESIYEARSIIVKNTNRHFSITDVAQQVGLNEVKLKTGFKQVFGTGVFQFMLQAKMQKAWTLILETNKPLKEIAMLAGYTSKQNFVTAFKKYFNATPGSLRRK